MTDYTVCRVCGEPLEEAFAIWAARQHEQKAHVGCMQVEMFNRYACCPKASRIPCVCEYATTCEVHETRHHGSHD